jgi:diguanylate cyclase (GGDEF)-like protein/PAS domain S-box-containing protein
MSSQPEANQAALIEGSQNLIWPVDLNHRLLAFNGLFQRYIWENIGIRNAAGMSLEEWQCKVARTFESDNPFNPIETVVVCKDGSQKEIRWGYHAIGDHCLAFGLDLSSFDNAEKGLLKNKEYYRTIFRTIDDAIDLCHLEDGRFIDVNDAFLQRMGFAREEVIGHTALELGIWVDPKLRQGLMEALKKHSVFRNLEVQYRTRDKGLCWGLLSASIVELEGTACILSITRGITEAKVAGDRLASAAEASLNREARYRAAFEASPDAVNIARISDGTIIDVNQTFLSTTGYKYEEVVGRTTLEVGIWVEPGGRELQVRDREHQFRRKNGEVFWARMSTTLIEINGEQCVISFARDISEAKAAQQQLALAQEALRLSEERYRIAFQTSSDAVMITSLDTGLVIDVNRGFMHIFGYPREEIIGRKVLEIEHWVDPQERKDLVDLVRANQVCQGFETRFYKRNREVFWGLVSVSRIDLGDMPCLLSITRDITAAKLAEERIQSLSWYDPLTNLPNRRLLMERLRKALSSDTHSHRKKALLLIDLDHFKTVNDTLGHHVGDLLLQEVARRITHCAQDSDTVARLGGDEFSVLLDYLSEIKEEAASQAQNISERILADIGRTYTLGAFDSRCSASIGITVFSSHETEAEEVLQQADMAMDQAKTAGRNQVRFFASALQIAIQHRAALENDLHKAILADQMVLYYQPQVKGQLLFGAEALVRWNHPTLGVLAPGEFIALAEETGLILPLGNAVLLSACRQIAAWADHVQGSQITLAVNISACQLLQADFVAQVLAALEQTGSNPKKLKLELTESMLVENVEEVIAKMARLKAYGVSFSLDDFGTGYSSLSCLKRLPLDELKIDLSFVRDLVTDSSSSAIIKTILALSQTMGLSTIAEGVETEAQRDILARLGCHAYQGYLFGQPLPLAEFEKLCSSWGLGSNGTVMLSSA